MIAVSDSSGDLVGTRNRYDEYGNVQGSLTGRFGYTGQPFVPEFGLYYYRARIYNPALGRFMQADPIGYASGMNLYAYVGNDPANATDPMGLSHAGLTGTRILYKPINYISGVCGSCSGSIFGIGIHSGGEAGSTNLVKVTEWDNVTKTPVGNSTFAIRLAGDWSFAAQGGGVGRRSLRTILALIADPDVNEQMAWAWAYSMGDSSNSDDKNEFGFWITQVGTDYRAGEILRGRGPFIYHVRERQPEGASIFFHAHPFYAGEIFGVNSIDLDFGDRNIASDLRVMVIAMARPARGITNTFAFPFRDCRWGVC